jgi:acetyl-CoA acetyltransferase
VTDRALWGRTAIVGIGESDYGKLYRSEPRSKADMAIEAVQRAILDAGIQKGDVDGLIVSGMPMYDPFMYRAGMQEVRFLAHYPLGGRLCPQALAHAVLAVHHGMANYVVLFNAVDFRGASRRFGGDTEGHADMGTGPLGPMYDLAYGMTSPGAQYALLWSRYLALYGGTDTDLAAIAVGTRRWASMNPNATFQDPLTVEEYLEAPYIAEPLRLFDYCLVSDGCAAYVITTSERAADSPHPPVLVGSLASRANIRPYYASEDFWAEACASLKRDLFGPADITLEDVDVLQVYDNFSPAVVWALEGLGIAPRGEGLQWVQGGRCAPGGELPVNTAGGMLSEAYLQGWNAHVEAVRQLRGHAGDRQVEDCHHVLYVGLSAVPGATLLFRDR